MAAMRANPRLQVGSVSWITEERASALQIASAEAEEFTFSARNEVDWLNEHMAEIFSKNQVNVAEIFKTPGKLRGKTPRTARKANPLEVRAPLSDVFSATPRGRPSPFKQIRFEKPIPSFQVAEDEVVLPEPPATESISGLEDPFQQKPMANAVDSGYHGSQPGETQPTQPNESTHHPTLRASLSEVDLVESDPEPNNELVEELRGEEERRSIEGSFQSAKEEQTRHIIEDVQLETEVANPSGLEQFAEPVLESPVHSRTIVESPTPKRSPEISLPVEESRPEPQETLIELEPAVEDEQMEDVQSVASDASSPIRPIVRKSSLNFASLPAREPITTKKSIGNSVSRTSQLEQSRTSYYGRLTGGKSIGNGKQDEQDDDDDEMDVDELEAPEPNRDKATRLHTKTSTQRLQDQISMLGKSQNARPPSKSIPGNGLVAAQQSQAPEFEETRQQRSPLRKERPPPGAFPEDEDDSWIGPPTAAPAVQLSILSPRPQITKSHSTDVMEEIRGKDSIGGSQFCLPKRGEELRQKSPLRDLAVQERMTTTLGHLKSASTSMLRSPKKAGDSPEQKAISVSNPNPSISEHSTTPPKSPSRSVRGSPLKAAKDKFSSILKTSRGLFASSAAVSAEAKTSAMSPLSSRIGLHNTPSMQSLFHSQPSYPDLSQSKSQTSLRMPDSPFKSARKTRASTEREERKKQGEAREAKEMKEAEKMNNQLEKARQKVKDEARVFHQEQERVATMQKEVAARQEKERLAKASQVDIPRATRSSPRKTKAQLEAEGIAAAAPTVEDMSNRDVEMSDVSQSMPPPAAPRPKSQIGRPPAKRPLKPAKETAMKVKPPTIIRVDTGSQRGHQNHPSNSTLAASLQDSLSSSQPAASSQGTLKHKASTSSIQSKTSSTSSFKSAATKALEAAARKKEQDEQAAQRKREAKQEVERQRAAAKEEEHRKEEQQRRREAERQRDIQRERERATAAADAKKAAQRQAMDKRKLEMEKAKETRAPPPAVRHQPNGDFTNTMSQEKALPPVPQSKAPRAKPAAQRSQEEAGRLVTSTYNSAKAPPKRPLQQDLDERQSRPAIQRNAPSYQHNEAHSKRRRTSEAFDDDEDLTENHPKMMAPPIRQSSIRQKDVPTKSLFPSGYANAPSVGANVQKSTLISQHSMNQSKPAHPMDMAQVSKAPIPFASSSSQGNAQPYRTPARPGLQHGTKTTAKSAKSSPRYQNGENINLPEILTDSEDEEEDDDDKKVKKDPWPVADWVNTPDITRAILRQEEFDPESIFGPTKALDMEEVFPKSKDRFHKFRARTSSANWTGEDRLTQDEIRKDIEGRDKLRRQGFWTYDSMV